MSPHSRSRAVTAGVLLTLVAQVRAQGCAHSVKGRSVQPQMAGQGPSRSACHKQGHVMAPRLPCGVSVQLAQCHLGSVVRRPEGHIPPVGEEVDLRTKLVPPVGGAVGTYSDRQVCLRVLLNFF